MRVVTHAKQESRKPVTYLRGDGEGSMCFCKSRLAARHLLKVDRESGSANYSFLQVARQRLAAHTDQVRADASAAFDKGCPLEAEVGSRLTNPLRL